MSVNWNMARSQQRSCGDMPAVDVTQYGGVLWPCTRSLSKGTVGPRFAALHVLLAMGLFFLLNGGVFPLPPTNASDVSTVPDLLHPKEYTMGESDIAESDTEKREDLYTQGEASGELAEAQKEQVYKEEVSGSSTGAGEYATSAGEKLLSSEAYLVTDDDQQRALQETAIAAEAPELFDSRDVIASSLASIVSESLQAAQSSLHGDAGHTNEDEVAAPGEAVENATERLNQAGAPLLLNLVEEASGATGVEETGSQWWDQDARLTPNADGNQVETAEFGATLHELFNASGVDTSEPAEEPDAQADAVATPQREGTEESAPEEDNQSRALTATGSAGTPPAESKTDTMVSANGGVAEETMTALTGAEEATAHSSQLLLEKTEAELPLEGLLSQPFIHGNDSEQHVAASDVDTSTTEGGTGTLVSTDGGAADDTTTAFTEAEWESTQTTQLLSESSHLETPSEDSQSQQLPYGDENEQPSVATENVPSGTTETDTFSGAAAQSGDVQPTVRAELSLEAVDAGHSHTEGGIDTVGTEKSREENSSFKSGRTTKLLRGAAVTESSVVRGTNPVSQSGERVLHDNSLTSGQSKKDVDCQSTSKLSSRHQGLALEVEEQGDKKTTKKTATQRGIRKASTHEDHKTMKNGAQWKKMLAVGAAAGLAAAGAKGFLVYSEGTRTLPDPSLPGSPQRQMN